MRNVYQFGAILLMASIVFILWSIDHAQSAQIAPIQCDDLESNIKDAIVNCATINGKHICYSSDVVIGLPFTPHFTTPNDRVSLRAFDEIYTIDTAGVAILNLSEAQEIRPLFGTLIGPVSAELEDGEILCLRALEDMPFCQGMPPGLRVNARAGQKGTVKIGQTEIQASDTVYVVADTAGVLRIINLAGDVRVTTEDYTVEVPEGYELPGIEGKCRVDSSSEFPGAPAPLDLPPPVPVPVSSPSPEMTSLPAEPSGPVLPALPSPTGTPVSDSPTTGRPLPTAEPIQPCDQEIDFGDIIEIENSDPGQICLISFCAPAGEIVTVEMTSLDGDMDPWVELRGPDDRTVKYNDDIAPNNRNSLICTEKLPVDGCYTIAARSYRYRTNGRFSIALTGGASDCTMPAMRCDVISRTGLNLRMAPSIGASVIAILPRGALLDPIAQTVNGDWIKVRTRDGLTGWVNAAPDLLMCDDKLWIPTTTPTLTIVSTDTPTPSPTVDSSKEKPTPTPRKPGIFTAPMQEPSGQ